MGNCTARAFDESQLQGCHFERSAHLAMVHPDGGAYCSRAPANTLQPMYDEDMDIEFGRELARCYIAETNMFLSRMPVISE